MAAEARASARHHGADQASADAFQRDPSMVDRAAEQAIGQHQGGATGSRPPRRPSATGTRNSAASHSRRDPSVFPQRPARVLPRSTSKHGDFRLAKPVRPPHSEPAHLDPCQRPPSKTPWRGPPPPSKPCWTACSGAHRGRRTGTAGAAPEAMAPRRVGGGKRLRPFLLIETARLFVCGGHSRGACRGRLRDGAWLQPGP